MKGLGSSIVLSLLALFAAPVIHGQVAYPDCYIQGVEWDDVNHYVIVPQAIFSPGAGNPPTTITGATSTEFVSATQIRLTPGFHAGDLASEGRFRAHISEGIGEPEDVIAMATEPYSYIDGNTMHVRKWEKLELGLKLPDEYEAAVSDFFASYYPYPNGPNDPLALVSAPSNVDAVHELNPYADDSLQAYIVLTSPSGVQRMKWGFYMREAKWETGADDALPTEDLTNPFDSYRMRFRFAPDEEGTWLFWIALRAPHTLNANEDVLEPLTYVGYSFVCDPPLDDNHGPLHVNQENRRIMQFEDGTPFFALGTNMADVHHAQDSGFPGSYDRFYQRDMTVMKQTMDQLHDVGGNYLRMWLYRNLFTPEWVNLGVYDAYRAPQPCAGEGLTGFKGNCQYQCWSFDQLVDHARSSDTYLQLCVDPGPPSIAYEQTNWGIHPYVMNYLDTQERDPETDNYDLKQFFYTPHPDTGLPMLNEGVFYYWKRKYKYIMSRWGYSVNVPILEPFNEVDQMLTYRYRDLVGDGQKCLENQLVWPADTELPGTINSWLTDLTEFVRGNQDLDNPVISPLGEEHKLFLMSYTDAEPATTTAVDYYLPFKNAYVDLIDVHKAIHPSVAQINLPDQAMSGIFDHAASFRANIPSTDPGLARKPFNQGEFQHYTNISFPGVFREIEKFFLNYDVSFHNELWAAAFSGKFAAGTTWHWERVFWWPNGLAVPPDDVNNDFQPEEFSNVLGQSNSLDIGTDANPVEVVVTNRRLHHHFRPLADLLSLAADQPSQFFNYDYDSYKIFSSNNVVECYYLSNGSMAIGWVHNRNAWTMNNFYIASGSANQNILGCYPPNLQPQTLSLTGLDAGQDYHINWFPTRLNATEWPADEEDQDGDGTVLLHIDNPPSAALGGTSGNYLDTLHADYAFIITPYPLVKSLSLPAVEPAQVVEGEWSFELFPNPAHGDLFVRLPNDAPYGVFLHDPSGRIIQAWSAITGPLQHLAIAHLAQGAYWVSVTDGVVSKTKKLIIH